jgi:competence protein ComEA
MRTLFASALALTVVLLSGLTASAQQTEKGAATTGATINLNSATVEELEGLPGIGPKTAQLIVEYRQKSGGFKKIEELMNVKGIGEKSFLKLKPMLVVTAKPEKTGGDD